MLNLCFLLFSLLPNETPEPDRVLPDVSKLRAEFKSAQAAVDAATMKRDAAKQAYADALKLIADAAAEDGIGDTPADEASAFTRAVQAAYTADPAANKAELVKGLVSLFRQSLPYVDSDATTGQLFTRMLGARRVFCKDSELIGVRKAADKPLLELMGPVETPFTPELRKNVKAQFERTIKAMGGLK